MESITDDMIYAFAAGVATAACLLLPFLLGGRKKSGAIAKPVTGLTGDEKKDFLVVFEALTSEVVAEIDQYNLPARTKEYMRNMIEYNVPKGKLTRGLTVISALKAIKNGGKPLSAVDYQRDVSFKSDDSGRLHGSCLRPHRKEIVQARRPR